ncbi:MAG: serine--tRNA ligase [Bacteroides sp.]|jgi:seryl-tRNA synthetase|nr:serine--tRNA ligase [Bacteroides sp.]
MIEIQIIRNQPAEVVERLKVKNFDAAAIIDRILEVDGERRRTQKSLDDTLAESNQLARDIGALFKSGKREEAESLKERTALLKQQVKALQEILEGLSAEQDKLVLQLPNLPHGSVPVGKSSEDNTIVHSEGEIPALATGALPHWELAKQYDLIDFECGTRITGAGFPVYKGKGARLQRALIGFFLDNAVEAGYTEYQPPLMVNEASAYATGQLPDKEGQMYHVQLDNLYLIPTAEVPVTNFFRDMILRQQDLPVMSTAYSACFRREAGSYGKDVRGLNRLHQFDKVEIVQITHPDKSYDTLDEMVKYVSGLLQKLELPFRVARLCGGDLSFASALTYDMEVYSAAQQRWLEVSSISNFETFQSNRMKLRFRGEDGKTTLAHTLNGSALALPRIVAALLENNQTPQGIRIPKALQPYTGFEVIA